MNDYILRVLVCAFMYGYDCVQVYDCVIVSVSGNTFPVKVVFVKTPTKQRDSRPQGDDEQAAVPERNYFPMLAGRHQTIEETSITNDGAELDITK